MLALKALDLALALVRQGTHALMMLAAQEVYLRFVSLVSVLQLLQMVLLTAALVGPERLNLTLEGGYLS
jgi:hypothetical protein